MVSLWLLCATLLAAPAPETLKAYEEAQSRVGNDSEAHVRLALWCEEHGLSSERQKHLALAVLNDPHHPKARALMGLVTYQNRWQRPDAVTRKLADDPTLAATLAEYNARRESTPNNADDQWELARWCERKGLKPEANAHLTAVTRLDPSRDDAWKKLGFQKHHGRWMRAEQITAQIAEGEAQAKADRHWQPLLERYRTWLRTEPRREDAEVLLADIDDPRAVPSVCRTFGKGDEGQQNRAVQILERIKAPGATRALAMMAVSSPWEVVRQLARGPLLESDPREFMDLLVGLLRDPVKYEVKPIKGPGTTGQLFVEGQQANLKRLYAPPPAPKFSLKPGDVVDYDDFGLPVITRTTGYTEVRIPGSRMRAICPNLTAIPIGRMMAETNLSARVARKQLEQDVNAVESYNTRVQEVNDRVVEVLGDVTGQDFGALDPESWRAWWTDEQGYSVSQPTTTTKATVTQNVRLAYTPQSTATRFTGAATGYRRGHSCFGAGTPVRTLTGLRPIETIQVGDQVLTQETTAGALTFQPVLAVFHNPPNQTYRINLGRETIVATGIHRFWKAGKGWTMTRDLKPGDSLHTLDGRVEVIAIEADGVEPVYNLEVGANQSFFVGERGVLVHDHSLIQPSSAPFDAAPPLAAVAPGPRAR